VKEHFTGREPSVEDSHHRVLRSKSAKIAQCVALAVPEVTIVVAVNRSAPVRTTMTRPRGKTAAPASLMSPGAFSWYHGAVRAVRDTEQPKLRETPCRDCGEEDLVWAGVALLDAGPRDELRCLGGSESGKVGDVDHERIAHGESNVVSSGEIIVSV
jgi:hypothetical protein